MQPRFLSILLILGLVCPLPAADAKKSPWLTDYEAARALARQTGKPLFIVFR